MKLVKEGIGILSRQRAPIDYDMNASFYIFTRDYISRITDRSIVYEMPHICFDKRHYFDFTMMELLLKHKALDFDL
ncbi:MAG: hypothetical protein RLO12_11020 [Fulvivirga sp.]